MIISVSGTPGTGKSKVSAALARKTGYMHLDINALIRKEGLYSSYDRSRRTYVADMRKVRGFVSKVRKKHENIILDSHISHELAPDVAIVLRCRPDVLEKRLRKRKWSSKKVKENSEAELIGVISYEARKSNKKVWEIDTTRATVADVTRAIQNILKGKGDKYRKAIEWLGGKD